MIREKNIYENIVKNEDTFTEAFINMLANDDVKNNFVTFLKRKIENNKLNFEYENIRTQFINNNYERPDIIINDINTMIIIENKINPYTSLTENQPEGYINLFKRKEEINNKLLIFMVPKEYMHTKELENRYKAIDKNAKKNIKFIILYWEEVLKKLENASKEKYFIDFIKKAKQFLNYKIILLEEYDLENIKKANVDSFIKMFEIIENLKKLLLQEKYKIEVDVNEFSYGLHLRDQNNGKYLLYIGLLYKQWREDGEPLYFGFNDEEYDKNRNKKMRKKISKYNFPIIKDEIEENWEYVNITISSISNSNDPSHEIKKIIMDILE